jgi:hypothetical protein
MAQISENQGFRKYFKKNEKRMKRFSAFVGLVVVR